MSASNPMHHDPATVPCETCGQPSRMIGTKRCDSCFETEIRLDSYLRRGGHKARMFAFRCITKALQESIAARSSAEGDEK